jgi:5-hydroxyisourate hydrolase
MGKLTTHVLNIAAGIPAAGMRVEVRGAPTPVKPTESMRLLGTMETNEQGRCALPLVEGLAFSSGRYALTFHVAAYFNAQGYALPDPPFLDEVVIAFGVADPSQNYHVPLLLTPWSYSTYRGS